MNDLEELDSKRDKLELCVTHLRENNKGLKTGNKLLLVDNQRLVLNIQRLTEELDHKSSKVNVIDLKLNDFADKGISLEMLERISACVEGSGDKLLVQLEKLEDRTNIAKDCDFLKKRGLLLQSGIKKMEKKNKRLYVKNIAREDRLETINHAIIETQEKFDVIENKVIDSINEAKEKKNKAGPNVTDDKKIL